VVAPGYLLDLGEFAVSGEGQHLALQVAVTQLAAVLVEPAELVGLVPVAVDWVTDFDQLVDCLILDSSILL